MYTITDVSNLPIYEKLDEIAESLSEKGTLILHAETGAGKTTLVPWHILSHKSFTGSNIILLQPRRLAARAAAERIAALCGEKIGQTVGLRTRAETIIGQFTRLEVMTEGVLTRIIQDDQSLERYSTIIFDEFHERSIESDLALALAWDCRETIKPCLKILFMSATPPAEEVRSTFGDIHIISVPGRAYPVRVEYFVPLQGEKPWEGASRLVKMAITMLDSPEGDILVFLPGFREIYQAKELLERDTGVMARVVILHGRIPPEEQRSVLNPNQKPGRRIILSTNVAETSVTVPGVRAVVDIGLERRVRYRPRTDMNHWETVGTSMASAEQRKGRAGRMGPGMCLRWWDPTEQREKFPPPEIVESDLAPLVLETALWGAPSPYDLKWVTEPPRAAVERSSLLLRQLSFIDDSGRITGTGSRAARLGMHPRLGHMIQVASAKGWLKTAAVTASIIEEGDFLGSDDPDFRERLSAFAFWLDGKPSSINDRPAVRIREEARRILSVSSKGDNNLSGYDVNPEIAGILIALAYPDRTAQKTSIHNNASRWVLATGRAAHLNGALSREDFLAVAELDGGSTDARIFLAAPIGKDALINGLSGEPVIDYKVEWDSWKPISRSVLRLGRLVLRESPRSQIPREMAITISLNRVQEQGLQSLPWNDTSLNFIARCRFVQKYGNQDKWPDFSPDSLIKDIETWLMPHGNYEGGPVFQENSIITALGCRLGKNNVHKLNTLAPDFYRLPSGSRKAIDYISGDIPIISARIQEFFGLRETPRLCGVPCVIHLLNPAGRPIQITRDLNGFWHGSYKDVKKEQMGRYPRHYWPDSPENAIPTAKVKPSK